MTQVSNTDESPDAPKKPSITLNDIAQVVEVLKVVTDRGVWKANELSAVGALYDRLTSFLQEAESALGGPAEEPASE